MIKVANIIGHNNKPVVNQFIIQTDKGTYFQSYKSIIAFKPHKGKIQIGDDWEYGMTTGKYRNIFLNEVKIDTIKKLKSGECKLTNIKLV